MELSNGESSTPPAHTNYMNTFFVYMPSFMSMVYIPFTTK